MGTPLAGFRRRKPDPADRRPAPPQSTRTAPTTSPRSRPAPSSNLRLQRLHRAGPRRDCRRVEQDRRRDRRFPGHSCRRAPAFSRSSRTSWSRCVTSSAPPRRTEITDAGADMEDEDLIQREDTGRHGHPCRLHQARAAFDLYPGPGARRQGPLRHGDQGRGFLVTRLFVANTHTPILFFSSRGIVYKEKVWRLPIGTPQSRGKFLRQHAAAAAGRAQSPPSCRCPRTRRAGPVWT